MHIIHETLHFMDHILVLSVSHICIKEDHQYLRIYISCMCSKKYLAGHRIDSC